MNRYSVALLAHVLKLNRYGKEKSHVFEKAKMTLPVALEEYILGQPPTGFKNWVVDKTTLKAIKPGDVFYGFTAINEDVKVDEDKAEFDDDNNYAITGPTAASAATSLYRLVQLGVLAPYADGGSCTNHFVRTCYSGFFDALVKPFRTEAFKMQVIAFQVPNYRNIVATALKTDVEETLRSTSMWATDSAVEMGKPNLEMNELKLKQLDAFVNANLAWMTSDVPVIIGGSGRFNNILRAVTTYNFSKSVGDLAQQVTDYLDHIKYACAVLNPYRHYQWKRDDEEGDYKIPPYIIVAPKVTSGLGSTNVSTDAPQEEDKAGEADTTAARRQVEADSDIKRLLIAALIAPGFIANHMIVGAHTLMSCRAKGQTAKVSDTVQDSHFEKYSNFSSLPFTDLDPFKGLVTFTDHRYYYGKRGAEVITMPLSELPGTNDVDDQDLVDQLFGPGYMRVLTSKKYGKHVESSLLAIANFQENSREKLLDLYKLEEAKLVALGLGHTARTEAPEVFLNRCGYIAPPVPIPVAPTAGGPMLVVSANQ